MTEPMSAELDPYYAEHLNGPHQRLWVAALENPEAYLMTESGHIKASDAGRPWGKPGRKSTGPSGPRKAPAPPRKKTPAAGARRGQADYTGALTVISELPCIALNVVAGILKSPAWAADAATIRLGRGPIIQKANQLIVDDPMLSASAERFLSGSAGGKVWTGVALALATLPLVTQIAANHRKTPVRPGEGGGLLSHEELFAAAGGGSPEAAMMDLLGAGGRGPAPSQHTAHHGDAGTERPEPETVEEPTIPLFQQPVAA